MTTAVIGPPMPPSTPPSDSEPQSIDLDRDVSCLQCGYNLRGLPGDPVRCPECFHQELRADVLDRMLGRMPDDLRDEGSTPLGRARRGIRDRCRLCGVAIGPLLLGLSGLIFGDAITRYIVLPMTITAAAIAAFGFVLLAVRCRTVPGWFPDAAWCLVWATGSMTANLCLATFGVLFCSGCVLTAGVGTEPFMASAGLLLVPLLVVLHDPAGALLKRPAKENLDRLARALVGEGD